MQGELPGAITGIHTRIHPETRYMSAGTPPTAGQAVTGVSTQEERRQAL